MKFHTAEKKIAIAEGATAEDGKITKRGAQIEGCKDEMAKKRRRTDQDTKKDELVSKKRQPTGSDESSEESGTSDSDEMDSTGDSQSDFEESDFGLGLYSDSDDDDNESDDDEDIEKFDQRVCTACYGVYINFLKGSSSKNRNYVSKNIEQIFSIEVSEVA